MRTTAAAQRLAMASAALLSYAATAATLDVRVAQGLLRGQQREHDVAFYAIPFAAPPVGELRWRAPRAAASWAGVRDATRPGAACMQEAARGQPAFPAGASEDCLLLNVFAPQDPTRSRARRPVMVWIHGGSFRWGSAMDPAFDGAALTRAGLVLVAINYRLDRFGRFAHPALSAAQARDEPLANYGLMDQLAALRWVRANIARFGGDPRKVTIFGCSAGGVSVDFLMTAPAARGLFHRAIAQSGSLAPEGERHVSKAVGRSAPLEQDGLEFAQYFGIVEDAETLQRLRALEATQVLSYPQKDFSMQPVVDGQLIPEEPARAFAAGRQARVPFMSGAASFEASLIRPFRLPLAAVLAGVSRASAVATYGIADDDERLKEIYFGDSLFLSTAAFATAQMPRVGRTGFLYEYAHVASARRGRDPGAYHCSETPRIFGTEWRDEAADDEDRRVGDLLRAYWVRFALDGDPNAPGLPRWNPNTDAHPLLMRLQSEPRAVEDPYRARMRLHRNRYERVLVPDLPAR